MSNGSDNTVENGTVEKGHRAGQASHSRVLIVDDHEDSLMLARYVVEEAGHHVADVLSGHDAIETAITYQPDLILLDIVLSDISGIEVFRQLKRYEQFTRTPVVAITALIKESVRQEAIAIGFVDYLVKPYYVEELCKIVEKNLSREKLGQTKLGQTKLRT